MCEGPKVGVREDKGKLVRNEGLDEQPFVVGPVELGSHARSLQALASLTKTCLQGAAGCWGERDLKVKTRRPRGSCVRMEGGRKQGDGSVHHKVPIVQACEPAFGSPAPT